MRIVLLLIAAFVFVPLLLAGWLTMTESGARAAFALAARTTQDAVQAEGVHGRLAGPLRIDRLRYDSAGQEITFDRLQLDWRMRALLERTLHIHYVHAAHIGVVLKEQQEEKTPPQMPDSIALPFKLSADKISIDAGEIRTGEASLATLGPASLRLEFDGTRYRLQLDRLTLRAGADANAGSARLSGEATLATAKPYPLQAEVLAGGDALIGEQAIDAQGKITAAGTLAQFRLVADLAMEDASVQGSVVLQPFAPLALGAADLRVKALDLARLHSGLPRTALNAQLSLAENGTGELKLENPGAGTIGEEKLPLSSLRLDFQQQAERIEFQRIDARLGAAAQPAGSIAGKGDLVTGMGGALTLDLRLKDVDLRRLDTRLQPTRLAGDIAIRHAEGRQEFTVDLQEPASRQQRRQSLALSVHALLAGGRLQVNRAELRAGAGRFSASGHLALDGQQDFNADVKMRSFRLQDIGDFAQWPELLLNGQVALQGARQPQLRAELQLDLKDSRIAGQPLQGSGRARLDGNSIEVGSLRLAAGANSLSMNGRLQQDEGQLRFDVTAPKLEQLGPAFGGSLQAEGSVRGSFRQPRIRASWKAAGLRLTEQLHIGASQGKADLDIDRREGANRALPISNLALDMTANALRSGAWKLDSLSAELQFSPQPNAPLKLTISALGVAADGARFERISLTGAGSTARHTLQAAVMEADQQWQLQASGGLGGLTGATAAPQWQGAIERLDASGRIVARLEQPAPVSVSPQRLLLERFRLQADAAQLVVEQFLRDAKGIVTRGRIERLRLAQLLKFAATDPKIETDLQLSGDWDLALTDVPSGTVTLRRDSGDVTMRGSTPVALGLSRLEAHADAAAGRITMKLRAEGRQLGRIDGSGTLALAGGKTGNEKAERRRFSISPEAPLSARIDIDLPSLAWAGGLVSSTLVAEGRLQGAVDVAGTLSNPQLAGRIRGSDLRLLFADIGVDLRQGSLDGEFRDSQVLINSLRFGNPGAQLFAAGSIDLGGTQPTAQATVQAEGFPLFDRSDRRLRISGASRIAWRQGIADISGDFKTDSGFIDIGSLDMPRLSDDVVIVGRSGKKSGGGGLPARIDVGVALGDGIALRGRGLDALLRGVIRLTSAPGEELRANGTLRVAKGTFSAYGRALAIETGVLRFNGPINNPALDILAMRRGQEVAAGVAVRGTVLAPRITLVSDPSVSDAEKLSWLVLGRGLGSAGEGDVGALQAAAGALLSQGAAAGVQSQIASAFGLDQLSIGGSESGTVQERIVTVGKQISARLHMSFQRGLETASSVLHLRYHLTRRITLEAEAGSRSALSVFYNFSFD